MHDKTALLNRLEAAKTELKLATTEMDSKKLTINGSFGKFGSKYSILYSPDLLIQTTLTGQLALLMLIEQLELAGIPITSANTDGIVIKCPRRLIDRMHAIIAVFEWFSCFETEETQYVALYSKDVNNYIAVKRDGKVKTKGLYASAGLMKNPTASISVDAVIANLTTGADIRSTIEASRHLPSFITIRSVKGGGVQDGAYLAKTVRWYYSTAYRDRTINYKTNGNCVAKSTGARAVMNLPASFPDDIDYDVYVAEAQSILQSIGATA
jgi:hypothetical protein